MRNGVLGLLLMLLSFTAWSDGFEKGWDAFVNGDYAGAQRQLAPLAKDGDAQAQYGLGLVYQRGWGREDEAVKWLTRAAEQDYAPAQTELGRMYQWGKGVEQNDEMAVQLYTLAAEQGYASAQYYLGMMYQWGDGVEQNDEMAIQWYTLAADQGLASAQLNLGIEYTRGYVVPQDYKMAEKWLTLAAEQPVEADDDFERIASIGRAQEYLADMYASGMGVERDIKQAAKWYTLAIELGSPRGPLFLGQLYAEPSEIKDNVLAYKWLEIALFINIKGASDARALVAAEMTPDEIAKAQQMANECIEQICYRKR